MASRVLRHDRALPGFERYLTFLKGKLGYFSLFWQFFWRVFLDSD